MQYVLVLVLLAMSVAAHAEQKTVIVQDDAGGMAVDYWLRLMDYVEAGSPIEIKGKCASACTIYLANPKTCVHKDAQLLFQAAGNEGETSGFGTDWMLSYYPPKVRDWIAAKGGLNEKVLVLDGKELERTVRMCGAPDAIDKASTPKPKARPPRITAAASTPVDRPETDEIVRRWNEANNYCRGGHGNESPAWCGVREGYNDLLTTRGWCHGKKGRPALEPAWHKCGPQSQRRGLFE